MVPNKEDVPAHADLYFVKISFKQDKYKVQGDKYILSKWGNPENGHNKYKNISLIWYNYIQGEKPHPVNGQVTPDTGADLNKQRGPE